MRCRRSIKSNIIALSQAALLTASGGIWAEPAGPPVKRARPPQWPDEVRGVFFDDVREKLVGPRPNYGTSSEAAISAHATGISPAGAAANPSNAAWSKLIDAETIETEIKRIAQAVAGDVAVPGEFQGGAYKRCRRHFSVLAVLFAVSGEYDGAVRWSEVAPALRDVFARAGYNCKVGTDQTYREAVQRNQDLAELVRGGRPPVASAERMAKWAEVADRAPLMQRLEIAHQERLTKWLSNEREFKRHRDEVRHEAQLVAAFADVIGREGFEYWDDEQYAENTSNLRKAGSEMAAAAELDNYERAKKAIGRATKACNDCHDGYRG
jgi:hypothetical protein